MLFAALSQRFGGSAETFPQVFISVAAIWALRDKPPARARLFPGPRPWPPPLALALAPGPWPQAFRKASQLDPNWG